jgi:P27 family predicted phage terminase small subunit
MRSTAHKKLAGTLRKSRQRAGVAAPDLLRRLPAPPPELNVSAREAWTRFGKLSLRIGVLTAQDLPLLALLARTWAGVTSLEAQLERDGLVIASGDVKKAHPGLQALDRARALAHRMLADLGLTPVGREKISVQPRRGSSPFVDV